MSDDDFDAWLRAKSSDLALRAASRRPAISELRRDRYGRPIEPAEPDPGPGWLRSHFMGVPWPRPGHEAPCGRAECWVCANRAFVDLFRAWEKTGR